MMAKRLEMMLLIEDNENDSLLTRRTILAINPNIHIVIQTTGEAALNYLRSNQPHPQLILLDLNLPGMNGLEFVRQMKLIKGLESIPVVVVTGFASDILQAHEANAAIGFIVKPIEMAEIQDILSKVGLEP